MEKKGIRIVIISSPYTEQAAFFQRFREKLEREEGAEVIFLPYDAKERKDLIGDIKALSPQLLITTDLSGFEQCTLTDNISYNLLDCKQLHVLFHENLPNERYLKKQLSISMFFYCAGTAYYGRLRRQYPDLPYLEELSGWKNGTSEETAQENAEVLYTCFRRCFKNVPQRIK